jgi:hypothetical protein
LRELDLELELELELRCELDSRIREAWHELKEATGRSCAGSEAEL